MVEFVDKMMASAVVANLMNHYQVDSSWFSAKLLRSLNSDERIIPRIVQNELFEQSLNAFGAESLVSASQMMVKDKNSLLLYLLTSVSSPRESIERLIRLKKYLHSLAQMKMIRETTNSIMVCHFYQGAKPHPGEHLFTFGSVTTLLSAVGCSGVSARWTALADPTLLKHSVVQKDNPVQKGDTTWEYCWKDFAIRPVEFEGLDEMLLSGMEPIRGKETLTATVERVFKRDLSRKWTLPDLSEQLSLPVRTLQRKLKAENQTFTTLMRSLRIEGAKTLLTRTTDSITEIGFSLGYADNAHFTREFKAVVGSPPTEYRNNNR